MEDKEYNGIIRKYYRKIRRIPSGVKPVLVQLQGIKAVIFDIYGTLLISDNEYATDDGRLAEETGVQLADQIGRYHLECTPDGLRKRFSEEIAQVHASNQARGIAFPEVDAVEIWKKILGTDDTEKAKRFAFEFEMIINHVNPSGNLKILFRYLKRRDIRIGIVSNAQFYTEKILAFFSGNELLNRVLDPELVHYSFQYGIAKPSPLLFEKVLDNIEAMGLEAHNVLFIGNDRQNDIAPAIQAGFRTALFAGDACCLKVCCLEKETDMHPSPDIVITDWKQIKHVIR